MARKRLYVSDVQAQVDDLRAQVDYWVDKYVELEREVMSLREDLLSVKGAAEVLLNLAHKPRPSLFRRFLSLFKA